MYHPNTLRDIAAARAAVKEAEGKGWCDTDLRLEVFHIAGGAMDNAFDTYGSDQEYSDDFGFVLLEGLRGTLAVRHNGPSAAAIKWFAARGVIA